MDITEYFFQDISLVTHVANIIISRILAKRIHQGIKPRTIRATALFMALGILDLNRTYAMVARETGVTPISVSRFVRRHKKTLKEIEKEVKQLISKKTIYSSERNT